ncbi:hypothetical protein E2C01_070859 [Portunus trituberculatus]|uniref:Uncharacterized protein n=1 Tax=Portunus trituberculatus TaxID=210409 RepID=A0A5B7I6G8_PORTR|nr:hypothetical protein [Portunus trituberculatus]
MAPKRKGTKIGADGTQDSPKCVSHKQTGEPMAPVPSVHTTSRPVANSRCSFSLQAAQNSQRNFKLRAREFCSWPIGGSSMAGSKKQVVVYVGTDNLHSNLLLIYQPL